MARSTSLILFAAFIAACSCQDPAYIRISDANILSLMSNTGGDTVITAITAASTVLKSEYETVLPVFEEKNSTCQELCLNCTIDACTAKAEGCSSSSGGGGLGDVISDALTNNVVADWFETDFVDFFADDIPDFFTGDFVDAFTNFGGTVEGGFVDIGNALNNVFNGVDNFFTNDFTGAFSQVDDFLSDIGSFFENDFVNAFEDLGDFVSGLFSGRKRRSTNLTKHLVKRQTIGTTEPTCSELEANTTECLYYTTDCPCDYYSECEGYSDAADALSEIIADGQWLSLIANSTTYSYGVTSIYYSFAYLDYTNGQYTNTVAEVGFFGYEFNVTIPEYVNVYDSTAYGPTIAKYAIVYFKDVYG